MYERYVTTTLKTGEEMEIGVVEAPDQEHADEITSFLGHKPGEFKWHIERSLRESLDELETRFYVGKVGGKVITNVMTVECHRTGILGHVFTVPEHRRKGAYSRLMGEQMEDFRRRGGGLLLLGTGYQSPPYWIYHRYGFRSVTEGSGFMRYASEEDFEAKYFAPGRAKTVEVQWKDWPRMNVLGVLQKGMFLRNVGLGLYGVQNFEGGFLHFKRSLEHDPGVQAKLLESDRGAIVGYATLMPDRRWNGAVALLDLYGHPSFYSDMDLLLEAMEIPPGKIQCHADERSAEKRAALEAAGFEQEAVLKHQVQTAEGERLDVVVYSKVG